MKKIGIILIIIMVISSVLGLALYNYYDGTVNTEFIYPGVTIDGVDVGNMTKEAAHESLKQHIVDKANSNMELRYEEIHFSFPYSVLGYEADVKDAIEEAYMIGREGNPVIRLSKVIGLKSNSEEVEIKEKFNSEKLEIAVETMAQDINREPINAKISIFNGEFKKEPEQDGIKLNGTIAKEYINANISNNDVVELPVDRTVAEVKIDSFEKINGKLGEFSTEYSGSVQNRKDNIALAASRISGTIILPGEIFSFNESLGDISEATGYKNATVIINGEFDSGVGGGVCQVSTTLYNAITKADLEVVERRNHSRPVAYVKRGTDAAVASGLLDLKFKNNYDFPIYIHAEENGSEILFSIYGDTTAKDYVIELETEMVEEIPRGVKEKYDPSLPEGAYGVEQKGNNGYKYKTYKVKKVNGEVVSRELYSSDYYPVRDRIVLVGPQVTETEEGTE
ncbi:MAG: hypothetical protein GXZ08_05220 [Tissierellia bacterium]|nr:hypothetical protein [Tissierellia bacterium]